jgi:ATP-binding cassette subfamily C (CFTR/MRP) protein 4
MKVEEASDSEDSAEAPETSVTGQDVKLGYEHASIISRLTYWFVNPLIRLGATGKIREDTGRKFLATSDTAEVLSHSFQSQYGQLGKGSILGAFLRAHVYTLIRHVILAAMETGVRIAQPIFLRQLLEWFSYSPQTSAGGGGSAAAPPTSGWIWASMITVFAYLYVLIHHQTFWCGMRNGMRWRAQAIAAVQAKVLELNASQLAKITSGKVINLVSNDVRRFDEALTFWPFLLVGPLELLAVFLLIGSQLGYLAAFAGISSLLMLIPMQSVLAKYIGSLRRRIAAQTDERVRLTGEAVNGITAFKMLSWEQPLLREILKVREKEASYIRRMNQIRAMNMALSFAIMPLASLILFTVSRYTVSEEEFTVSNVFFGVSLLALPKLTMCEFFVHAVEACSECYVSIQRIGAFLSMETPEDILLTLGSPGPEWDEGSTPSTKEIPAYAHAVSLKHADFTWNSENGATLKDVTLELKEGELVAVVGAVGAGKTSLLNAIIGEMSLVGQTGFPVDKIQLNVSSLSYCSQKPFIVSGSIQENILFGSELDEEWYATVIHAVCLDEDIDNLVDGDQTMIGERGINLSGGQKARLALARAMYKKADLNLLDDPLSALDSKVGAKVFSQCLSHEDGITSAFEAKRATTLLVTHQKQYLAFCDRVIVLRDGRIVAEGTLEELQGAAIPEVIITDDKDPVMRLSPSMGSLMSRQDSAYWRKFVSRRFEGARTSARFTGSMRSFKLSKSGRIISKEDQEIGGVSWVVYLDLIKEFGLWRALFLVACLLVGQGAYIMGDYWLATWAASDIATKSKTYWIWVYAIFVGTILLVSLVRAQVFFMSSLRASSSLHKAAINRLVRAPLSFFHTNPSGRVLNRFSKDLGVIDEQLPTVSFDSLQAGMMVVGALILLCVAVPVILPIFVPLLIIFVFIQRRYLKTSRELKRFEAVTRSPVYQNFSNILKGLTVIRVFKTQDGFRRDFLELLSNNIAWWYNWICSARWIGFRLDFLVALLMTAAPLLMVGLRDRFGEDNVKLVGLALSQSLYLAGLLQWMVRQTAEVENNMTSAERVFAYTRLEQEPPTVDEGGALPPPNWPSNGSIKYSNVDVVYRKGLPRVLKDLSFEIPGGTSCGIVGRTGSGKSSLMLSLFRLIPVTGGCISIDDVDINSIAIDILRSQIAIIPQDPTLFSGTLRSNLDPFEHHSDEAIWRALEMAKLKSHFTAMSNKGLYVELQECGDNLSCGQRQLVCLARVLLNEDSRILALDEATANVDSKTDLQIQDAVHRACNGDLQRTLLVIAHRLDTIMDCDNIIVLSKGALVESGNPRRLLEGRSGVFYEMARNAKITK